MTSREPTLTGDATLQEQAIRHSQHARWQIFEEATVLADSFVVKDLIGHGGMGQVFDGYDRNLARRVAIKASWPHLDPDFLKREAQALAAVRHPGIVTVYSSGCHEGTWYVVMERLFGAALDEHLARKERLSVREVLEVLIAVADALAAVHEAGIAHRDIKPSNIMLLPRGRIVLLDFGLFQPDGSAVALEVCGTPVYMAPETARGRVLPRDEHLVDLYALGIVAWELLVGKPPFDGNDNQEVMRMHVESVVPKLRTRRADVPEELEILVSELLEKNPRVRVQSAALLGDRLKLIRAKVLAEPFRALVVDDDPQLSRQLEFYLKTAAPDIDVMVVSDGEAAVQAMTEFRPDVALVDMQMPHMSGLELIMYLSGAHLVEQSAIAVVSGGAQANDVELLHSLGVDTFIRKNERMRGEVVAFVRRARQRWSAA